MATKAIKQIDFVSEYLHWLHENINSYALDNGVTELVVPFLDFNNDHMHIYVVPQSNSSFLLTDDSNTINELEMIGVNISTGNRKALLNSLCVSKGVTLTNKGALTIKTDVSGFARSKHMLIQAMTSVTDMFLLNRSNVKSVFFDDVASFLDANSIPYVENMMISGKSGLPHHYDFVIPQKRDSHEKLVRVANRIDATYSKLAILSLIEVKDVRKKEIDFLVFFNDINGKSVSTSVDALENYGVRVLPWSKKDESLEFLRRSA